MSDAIRWKQRYGNFDRAYRLLREGLAGGPGALSPLEKEGIIQRFEYTFELAWNALKDFMQDGGVIISPLTPRQVLKEAFRAQAVEAIASRYFPAMRELHQDFAEKQAEPGDQAE